MKNTLLCFLAINILSGCVTKPRVYKAEKQSKVNLVLFNSGISFEPVLFNSLREIQYNVNGLKTFSEKANNICITKMDNIKLYNVLSILDGGYFRGHSDLSILYINMTRKNVSEAIREHVGADIEILPGVLYKIVGTGRLPSYTRETYMLLVVEGDIIAFFEVTTQYGQEGGVCDDEARAYAAKIMAKLFSSIKINGQAMYSSPLPVPIIIKKVS